MLCSWGSGGFLPPPNHLIATCLLFSEPEAAYRRGGHP
jgi:hypothetical protein